MLARTNFIEQQLLNGHFKPAKTFVKGMAEATRNFASGDQALNYPLRTDRISRTETNSDKTCGRTTELAFAIQRMAPA